METKSKSAQAHTQIQTLIEISNFFLSAYRSTHVNKKDA